MAFNSGQLWGYAREEAIGKHFSDFLTVASTQLAQERILQSLKGEEVSPLFELECVRKDGSTVTVEGRSRFIRDTENQMLGIQAAFRDVTDRKQMEAALRESEARYRGLVESRNDLIIRVDPEGRFTFVNDAYCQKFGQRKEDLLGSSFVPLIHGDDQATTLEAMRQLAEPPYRMTVEQRPIRFLPQAYLPLITNNSSGSP